MKRRLICLRWRLDRNLFPQVDEQAVGHSATFFGVVMIASLLLVAVFLQLVRIGLGISLDSLWAEDGQVFLQSALTRDITVIGSEYSGYLVVFERLVAEVASALPLRYAPLVFSLLASAAVALSGLAVWHAARGHIADPLLRAVLVGATVLAPVAGLESISSASYAPWYMLFATFWLILWRPRTLLGAASGGAFIVLTTLSTPVVFFLLPLAVLRCLVVHDCRDGIPIAGFFVAALPQMFVVATTNYDEVDPVWADSVWTVLLQRVADGAILGLRLGGAAWAELGWVFLIFATSILALGFLVGLWRTDHKPRALASVAIPLCVIAFMFAVYQRGLAFQMLWPAGTWSEAAGRYAILPVLLLMSVAFAIIDSTRPKSGSWRLSRVGAVVAATVLVSIATSYRVADPAVRGTPPWGAAVNQAARECRQQNPAHLGQIPISPPGFVVTLPCSTIEPS